MAKELYRQINFDDHRKELDGKIGRKVSKDTFYWIMGLLVTLFSALIYIVFCQMNSGHAAAQDKIEALQQRCTAVEVEVKNLQKQIDSVPRLPSRP